MATTSDLFPLAVGEVTATFKSSVFLAGLFIALSVWLIGPLIDSLMLGKGSLPDLIRQTGASGFYMCAAVSASILLFSFVCGLMLNRMLAARKSLENYKDIVSGATDKIALLNTNYEYVSANKAYLDAFNKTEDEVIGHSVTEILGEKFFESVVKTKVDRCLAGDVIKYETWLNFPHDGKRYVHASLYPHVKNNEIVGFIVFVRDITGQKMIEEDLRFHKFAIEHAADCIYWMNPDSSFFYVNQAACDSLGYSNEELLSMNVFDIDPAINREQWEAAWESIKQNHYLHLESKHRTSDGRIIDIDVQANYLKYEGREYNCAIVRDITERKQAEDNLKDSMERYQMLVENAPFCIHEFDLDGYLTSINSAGLAMLNASDISEITGLNYQDKVAEVDSEFVRKCFKKALKGQASKFVFKVAGNELRYFDSSFIPIMDHKDHVLKIMGVTQDITERKLAEQKMVESEERYRGVVEDTPVLICKFSPEGELTFVNRAYSEYFSRSVEDLIGENFLFLFSKTDRGKIARFLDKITRETPIYTHESCVYIGQDDTRWHRWTNRGMYDEAGNLICYQAIGEDITQRKLVELQLENRTQKLIENQTVLFRLAREEFPDMETAFKTITRTVAEQLEIARVSIWLFDEIKTRIICQMLYDSDHHESDDLYLDVSSYPDYFQALLREGVISTSDARNDPRTHAFRDNYLVPLGIVSILDVPIVFQGEIVGIVCHEHKGESLRAWTVEDLEFAKSVADMCALALAANERKLAQDELSYQASHDPLTGLANRYNFECVANELINSAQNEKNEHALCFLDLDQFKVVNDTCGHTAGDELLRQLGDVLQNHIRKIDTLARIGGDEFAILMEHCSLEHAQRVANTLLKAIQDYQFIWEEHVFRIGVSIGLVSITEATGSLTELLKQADAACYMAKDHGRNRVHIYHPEDEDLALREGEMQWVARINSALLENRFLLYAQPIVSLGNSSARHYELLLRMVDDKGDNVPPGAFLPAAERYDLIARLDNWVIHKSIELLKTHRLFLDDVNFVSINLSGHSLVDRDIRDYLVRVFRKKEIPPGKICFEITETAAISNLNMAQRFITEMKRLGCRFALDDFGSGLSSFGYLKNLPVEFLKIDGMFVKKITSDQIDHAMVRSINEIGQVMGMKTIAEFVENDEIKGMLREIGVDYAQGYGIGIPVPFTDILGQSSNITSIKEALK